jgi:hypothetical protein
MIRRSQIVKIILVASSIISCNKDDEHRSFPQIYTQAPTPPQSPPLPQSFSGQEFLFENLSWQFYHSGNGSPWWDEIYLSTPAADAFRNSTAYFNNRLNIEVSIKFDTAAHWNKVLPDSEYDFLLPVQYTYNVYSPNLVVNVWPLNHQLVGKKASIRVKFLQ